MLAFPALIFLLLSKLGAEGLQTNSAFTLYGSCSDYHLPTAKYCSRQPTVTTRNLVFSDGSDISM